jgi:hypothetical protein
VICLSCNFTLPRKYKMNTKVLIFSILAILSNIETKVTQSVSNNNLVTKDIQKDTLIHIVIKLFADDTTLIIAEHNLDTCKSKFKSAVLSIIQSPRLVKLTGQKRMPCSFIIKLI